MEPIAVALENHEDEKASYIYSKVTYKTDKMPTNTVKGSQFSQPYLNLMGLVQVVEKHLI